jgi:hypothetical protein
MESVVKFSSMQEQNVDKAAIKFHLFEIHFSNMLLTSKSVKLDIMFDDEFKLGSLLLRSILGLYVT